MRPWWLLQLVCTIHWLWAVRITLWIWFPAKRPDIGQDDLRLDRSHHKSLHNNHYQCSLTYHLSKQSSTTPAYSLFLHLHRPSPLFSFESRPAAAFSLYILPSFLQLCCLPFHASIIWSALWSVPSWLLCCAWCERLLLSEAGWINISSAGTSRSYQQREPLPSAHTSVSSSR